MIVLGHDCVGTARRRHRISLLCVRYFSASIWLNFCVCRNCLNHLIIYAFKSLGAGFVAWRLVLGILSNADILFLASFMVVTCKLPIVKVILCVLLISLCL